MTHSMDEARALGRKYNHNKHICKCDECIKIRMAKAIEKIEERAKQDGKIPMTLLCYKMERIKDE